MNKAEAARRQLGTALALFLDDRDPVSVHTLAHAGAELADGLATAAGATPFRIFRSREPGRELTDAEFFRLKNLYANAFKHSSAKDGQPRLDADTLASFTDEQTDPILFGGWFDYACAGHPHPVESHVFQAWHLCLANPKMTDDDGWEMMAFLDRKFPGLRELSRSKQKRRLRRMIEECRQDRVSMNDAKTDRRPLILSQ